MSILYDAVIALLAAAGVFAVVWLLVGMFIRPKWPRRPVVVVIPAKDATLTESIQPLLWLRFWGVCDLRIMVPEETLTPEQRKEAETLMQRDVGLSLTDFGRLTAE